MLQSGNSTRSWFCYTWNTNKLEFILTIPYYSWLIVLFLTLCKLRINPIPLILIHMNTTTSGHYQYPGMNGPTFGGKVTDIVNTPRWAPMLSRNYANVHPCSSEFPIEKHRIRNTILTRKNLLESIRAECQRNKAYIYISIYPYINHILTIYNTILYINHY